MTECSRCEGTGLFAKKTWDSPAITCDDCSGTGTAPTEKPDPVDGPAMDGESSPGKRDSAAYRRGYLAGREDGEAAIVRELRELSVRLAKIVKKGDS